MILSKRRYANRLTFFSVSVVKGEIKITTLAHLTVVDDLSLQVPDRNTNAIEKDALEIFLRLESVIHVPGHIARVMRQTG